MCEAGLLISAFLPISQIRIVKGNPSEDQHERTKRPDLHERRDQKCIRPGRAVITGSVIFAKVIRPVGKSASVLADLSSFICRVKSVWSNSMAM